MWRAFSVLCDSSFGQLWSGSEPEPIDFELNTTVTMGSVNYTRVLSTFLQNTGRDMMAYQSMYLQSFCCFFCFYFSSRDVKLKKFLEVSLLHCFWLLVTVWFCSICVVQFQCPFNVCSQWGTWPQYFWTLWTEDMDFIFLTALLFTNSFSGNE